MNDTLTRNWETERRQILEQYEIMDTPAEEVFDRITALAVDYFNVPIAGINLIDGHRIWLKAEHGFHIRQMEKDDDAPCAHVIRTGELLVVPDAQHSQFKHCSLVQGQPHVRFYAGAPLTVKSGHTLGTLSLIDTNPRELLGTVEQRILMNLASMVVDALENRLITKSHNLSEERFKQLADSVPEAILMSRGDYIVYANSTAEAISGYQLEEFADRPYIQLVHPDSYGIMHARAAMHARGETLGMDEVKILTKSGETKWVELNSTVLNDGTGTLLSVVRDVTEKRATHEKLSFQASLLKQVHSAVVVTTSGHTVTYWNKAAEELYGFTACEVLGKHVKDVLLPHGSSGVMNEVQEAIQREGHWFGEALDRHKDGTLIPVLMTVTALHDVQGAFVGYLGVKTDIRNQKAREQALVAAEQAARQSEEQLAEAQALASMGSWSWNFHTDESTWSRELYRIYGLDTTEERIDFESYLNFVHPDDRAQVRASLQQLYKEQRDFTDQFRIVRPDGVERIVKTHGRFIFDDTGEPQRMYGTTQDVTEQVRAEQELETTKARLEFLLSTNPAMIYSSDAANSPGVTFMSSNIQDVLGYHPSEFLEHPSFWHERLHPDERDQVMRDHDRVLETGKLVLEYRFLDANGSYRWMRDEARLIRDNHGQALEVVGCWTDITERKTAAEELERSERRFRTLVQNGHDMITLVRPSGRIVFESPSVKRTVGYVPEELVGLNVFSFIHPDDVDRVKEEFSTLSDPTQLLTTELRFRNKDGSWRWLECSAVNLVNESSVNAIVINSSDITERKLTQQALEASEQRYRDLFTNASIGIYRTTPDGQVLMANPSLLRMLRYDSFEQLSQRNLEQEGYPEGTNREDFKVLFNERDEIRGRECSWLRADGTSVHVRENARAIRDAEGHILCYEGTVEDISEKKAAEEALRESEDRYRRLFLDAPIGVFRSTPEGRLLMANPAMLAILGCSSLEEAQALDLEVDVYGDRLTRATCVAQLESQDKLVGYDVTWHKRDGSLVHVRENAKVMRDSDGKILFYEGTIEDITEKKRAEDQVRRSEQHYQLALQSATAGTWEYNFSTQEEVWSEEAYRIYGVNRASHVTNDLWRNTLHPEDRERVVEFLTDLVRNKTEQFEHSYRTQHPSHGVRWIETRGRIIYDSNGKPHRMFGVDMDVTLRKETEHRLASLAEFRSSILMLTEEVLSEEQNEGFYDRLLRQAVNVISGAQAGSLTLRTPDGYFEFVAAVHHDLEMLKTVRFPADEVTFGNHTDQPQVITTFNHERFLTEEERHVLQTGGRAYEIRAILAVPIFVNNEVQAYMMLDNFDSKDAFASEAVEMARVFAGHVAVLLKRFELEKELHRLAYQDPLTELANRTSLKNHIDEVLQDASTNNDGVAVLFVDLDNLKQINDSLGHKAGDEVLRAVAKHLQESTRDGDMVARLSGDEFALVITGHNINTSARRVAERIMRSLTTAIRANGQDVHTSASIGISLYPEHGSTPDELLKAADIAMYHAKTRGKNTYAFFAQDMKAAPLERLLLEEALRRALERDEFVLHYQPRIDIHTGKILSLEALVR